MKQPAVERCLGMRTLFLLLLFLGWGGLNAETLRLPLRPFDAPGGAEFTRSISLLELAEREEAIITQILSGNMPSFLRHLRPVRITEVMNGVTNTAILHVAPDYLAVGSDADYFLAPVSPGTAQRLADALDCSLPTPKIVDAIYTTAEVKLPPCPIPPSPAMTSVFVFSNHNAIVRAQRAGELAAHPIGALVAGHKKDVVLSAQLATMPGKVAIYGWHRTNDGPIQPLHLGHTAAWVDYSQCTRLVNQNVVVNGQATTLKAVLADTSMAGLLSREGVILNPRYPTNAASAARSAPPSLEVGDGRRPLGFGGFTERSRFQERVATFFLEPEIRVQLNAPSEERLRTATKTLLVLYALPNGNTIEQTAGRLKHEGEDWRYGIQHVAAQTRFVRERLEGCAVVVAYLENSLKSWPAWRKKHGDKLLPGIIAAVEKPLNRPGIDLTLNGHSGGGSFIFGYLNAVDQIPDRVGRIGFLDSNYAYDSTAGHKAKLVTWLKSNPAHCLCVLAYNDAAALLDGKAFVSPAGGTWGKSHEMQRDLAETFTFTRSADTEFERFSALEGRVQFILKENPDRKVLHTVQVERNGFIHSLLSGTPLQNKEYQYYGSRAYEAWIDEAPAAR